MAGNESFQAASLHAHPPIYSCQASSPSYFAAAGNQDIMSQENKRKRERAFQGGSVEPGRSRGLRNGECDPLELAWCTPMNPQ